MRHCYKFTFAWAELTVAEQCQVLTAGGNWRHGVVHHTDGYELRESVSRLGFDNAVRDTEQKLIELGVAYTGRSWTEVR
jgi:hypothetical protein